MEQYSDYSLAGCYNIGPDDCNCVTTGELVNAFCEVWNSIMPTLRWECQIDGGPHEANFLKLNSTKVKNTFNWCPKWTVRESLKKIVEFENLRVTNAESHMLAECMWRQIEEYVQG